LSYARIAAPARPPDAGATLYHPLRALARP